MKNRIFDSEQLYSTKMLLPERQSSSSNNNTLKASSEGITWEQVRQMPVIRLYAGDIPERKEYEGLIGLSLTRNNHNHLRHDITQPLPLADNSVDSFQAEDVLEHIPYEKLAPIINEIYRVLKAGGLFRLSVPDYGCDILQNRSIKDEKGEILFDPEGGGTPSIPGHVWFPRIDTVMQLLTKTKFHESGKIEPLHYYNKDGTFFVKPIDYSKGHILRTPDFDERVKSPYRPMSLVVDLTKGKKVLSETKRILCAPRIRKSEGPKFSFVMIVLNGMPFIEYSLKSVYEFAHEIIIIEGAVEKCMFAADSDGSSTDGTVEFIKSFPDTQNKIRLIQGKWPEKCEMQNEALKYVTGDYVWLIDSDEVYKREDLEKIKEVLKADPSITQVNFIPDSFWKGPNYIFVSPEFFKQWCHYRRLFKYVPGAVFTSHRPPTMLWPGSDKTTEQMHLLDGTTTRQLGIIFYHYSYVLDKQVKQKIELYHRYGWGENWNIDLLEWYNKCFLEWTPENRQEIDLKYPIWTGDKNSHTLPFTGTHPEVMRDFVDKYYDSKTTIEQPSPFKTPDFTPVSAKNRDSSYNEMLEKIITFSKSIPEDKLKNGIVSATVDSTEFALQKLGTHYGGWVVPVNKIFSDSICYCVGAGEDISFDIELINRFGCEVFSFDPTPRAQAHIRMLEEYTHNGRKMPINNSETDFYDINERLLDKIKFFPYGIWSKSEVKKFFAPRNPEHVSHSILNLQKTTKCFEAQCLTIKDTMRRLGHEKVDLLKIDIEGAEYEVIDSIIKDNIEIGILCVEFDELNSPSDQNFKERIENSIRKLFEANFVPLFVDGADYTFINADILLAREAMAHPKLAKMNLPERLLRRPQYLKIETTNICNANCTFCMYRFMKREKGIMPMELFKKVVDDYVAAGGGALTISPLVGDCLVDSKLLERLRYCRNFNEITHMGFHTNMIGLNRWTDEQLLEMLDLIDVWNCSIGPNRDVYKDMFGVDQFERVIANLERFHRLLNLSEHKPLVQLNGRAAGGVFEKDERLRRLSLAITGKEMTWMTSYMDWGGLLQELPRNTKIIKTTGYTNKQSPCMKGLVSAVVFCDGRVGFCGCADYDAILTIGDINKERLGKILAGKQRQEIMASFGKSGLNEYCQKCSFYQPVDLKWISKWIPGTNPHHPDPVRPSLQRNIKPAAKARMADSRRNLPISEGKSETINAEKKQIIQAQSLLNQGHIIKALKEFEDILARLQAPVDALLGRSVCLARLGRLMEAEIEAKNALNKDPHNPRLLRFAEQMRRLKPDLIGDRDVEWGYIISRINEMAKIQGKRARLLDFGCGQSAQLARSIARLGCQITAIDMMPLTVSLDSTQNINFIQGDFLRRDWTPQSFDLIINCSSIEHSGLVGRYGVVEEGPDDDLEIMARMGRLIKPDGKMLLTIPVGLDKVVGSLHRVYGQTRLVKLLDGWEIESSCFWIKDENNQWRQVDEESALQREPMLAYALGCFVLRPAVRITTPSDSKLVPIYGQKLGISEHSKDMTTISVTASTESISPTFKQAPKVLIVRTDGIGDFVIFSGALPYYRKLYPDSHIAIIVRECSAELAEACPYIDEVIVNHRKLMVYDQNYAAEFINRIRAAKFDIAICPIYSRDNVSDFITMNSGASERIVSAGNDSNMSLEQISNNNPHFTKLVPARTGTMPEIERNKEFLEALGVSIDQRYETTVWIKQEHKDFADRLLKELNIEKPIVVGPFAQYSFKNWTLQKWAKLISIYKNYPIIICGADRDTQEAQELISLINHRNIHNLCGKTTLRQLAAILARSELYLGADSGPAHIAATVNCPQVVIMGGGHFGRFTTYSSRTTLVYSQMDCYGCNWRCKYGRDIRCINAITIDMVEQAANDWLKKAAESSIQDQKTSYKQPEEEKYLVSAIISTYNSEKFIRGCLEDLENQTIADRLEIIVVDSGSQQNEEAIVREFQSRYDNIKYIKTEKRETIYAAWNRAIKAASGKYITNANTDDRHRQDALEIMARALDENPDKALVYANQLEVNETDGRRVIVGERIYGQFSRSRLFNGECLPGSQPMWRKDVHDVFGCFDESFVIGGDYEFWFRLTQKFDFLYLNEVLGERFIGTDAVSQTNDDLLDWEGEMVIRKCYEYALQEAITVGVTGISRHPVFSTWPEVNIWKQNTKAKLEGRQVSLVDNIKESWDFRTNPSPKLTIIIVTYNRHKELLENLYALNEQDEKDFQVIIMDNGGDLSWLKQRIDEFNFGLCGIELKFNFGPSPARNIGTEFAKAGYIAFLDDDAVADKHLVRNILEHFENYRICGLRGKVLPKSQTNSNNIPVNYDLGEQIITTACDVSSFSAFRKDVLVKMGGFDELLYGSEGMELSYRICKTQKEKVQSILYFPDVIVYHEHRSEGPAKTEKTLRQLWMDLWAWRKDNDIRDYKEFVYSQYPRFKDTIESRYSDYAWVLNGAMYLRKNFPEEAIKWAEKAVALEPETIKGCYVLGSLYTDFGRYDEALILLKRIYEPLQNSTAGRSSEFIKSEFESQAEISKCYLSVCTQLAQCYMQNNQYEKIKQIYRNLLNTPNLTIPQEQRTRILNVLTKLDRTQFSQFDTKRKNNTIEPAKSEQDYLVSAIVSTYNSQKFLRGCLEDLEHQTIADKLQIIVINSGSRENEKEIVREYQQRHNNIIYIKTEQREGIYTAWNRAVKVARGIFLTNANTDDRHREDALEIMAKTLLENPDIALVYADQIRTDTSNDTFDNHHGTEMLQRPEYSRERLLFGCCVGSQPMWRNSLHDEFGYFDDTLTCAGDWDFWLRISSKYKFKHIPEFLGLYYYNENGIEHGRKIHSLYERYIVGRRYGNPYISVIPLYKSKDNPLVSVIMPAYNAAEHIAEAIESVLIQNYRNFELIVVDDGSTDDTKKIVASFKNDKIKYFYKDNGGPSSARNLAISKAKGQYIMPLDSDDMMTPDFIAKHLAEFEKHPEADLIYCDVLLIDSSNNPIRIMNKLEYQDRRHLIRDLFRAGHPIVPFRLGIRRGVFDKIGLYDECLLIAEDYDMMRRFVKAGLKAHHLSEPLHIRRIHTDSLSRNYSAQKAKCHFDVIKRFIDTFAYDELFPDVAWEQIAPEIRQLHAKCLAAGNYLAIGQEYIKTDAAGYARTAFDRACSELNDCVKMAPENQSLRQLLQKIELIRAGYSQTVQQAVS